MTQLQGSHRDRTLRLSTVRTALFALIALASWIAYRGAREILQLSVYPALLVATAAVLAFIAFAAFARRQRGVHQQSSMCQSRFSDGHSFQLSMPHRMRQRGCVALKSIQSTR